MFFKSSRVSLWYYFGTSSWNFFRKFTSDSKRKSKISNSLIFDVCKHSSTFFPRISIKAFTWISSKIITWILLTVLHKIFLPFLLQIHSEVPLGIRTYTYHSLQYFKDSTWIPRKPGISLQTSAIPLRIRSGFALDIPTETPPHILASLFQWLQQKISSSRMPLRISTHTDCSRKALTNRRTWSYE